MGADHAPPATPAAPPVTPGGPGISDLNPVTGLSSDYLNHFTEAMMALEMVSVAPDCLADLMAWRPLSYCEHFAASGLSSRNRVIAAYEAADPKLRRELDAAAAKLNAALQEARDAVIATLPQPAAAELAACAAARLRPLIARTTAVINGGGRGQDRHCTQAAIDTLFNT